MKYFVLVFIIISLGSAANIARAPEIQVVDKVETKVLNTIHKSTPISIDHPMPIIIDTIPDLRSTAGTEGKNIIFAEDGQSIAIIYGKFSGNPSNIFQIFVSYSTDRGITWARFGPLSTFNCRRAYSGLDAEQDFHSTGQIYFTWCQSTQDTGYIYFAKELSFPDGLITTAYPLPNSQFGFPCIGIEDTFGIITGGGRIWHFINGDTGRVFFPGAEPHFRYGNNGYIFFLWVWGDSSWPYYCESFDYGVTWTQPELIWQNLPPYPIMSNVRCYSHSFDCEMVCDTPVVTLNLSSSNYVYGELWVYRPVSGNPGNWQFQGTKLIGCDSTEPGRYIRYPTVAADVAGSFYIGYQTIFETPTDTGLDCGLFVRPSGRDSWIDCGQITHNAGDIEEGFLEFAHNAPIVGDSVIIGMIYSNALTYPTMGYLYFDSYKIPRPGIEENIPKLASNFDVKVLPIPFSNRLTFSYPKSNNVKLEIFDVSGRLVHKQKSNHSSTSIIWDCKDLQDKSIPMGVYFYKLNTDKNSATGKIIRN